MIMKQRVFAVILVSFAFFSLLNIWVLRSLRQESKDIEKFVEEKVFKSQTPPTLLEPRQEGGTHALVPEDPSKYGMIAIRDSGIPKEQMEWDLIMERALKDSRLLETEEGREAVDTMGTSQEKFGETMSRVEEKIQHFEQQQNTHPLDAASRQRLQTLYKLKALGKIMKDHVAVLPAPRDLPVPTRAVE